MNQKIEKGNKIIIKDRSSLHLIEVFMGYPEGYLSQIITWNDIMPIVEKIEDWTYRFHIEYCGSVAMPFKFYVFVDIYHVAGATEEILETPYYDSKIEAVCNGVIEFIEWHNKNRKYK